MMRIDDEKTLESVMTFMNKKVLNGLTIYSVKYQHNTERGLELSHNVMKEPIIEDVVGKKSKIKAYENYL